MGLVFSGSVGGLALSKLSCELSSTGSLNEVYSGRFLSLESSSASSSLSCSSALLIIFRYSVDVFQPPVKTDSRMSSQPSPSNLSNSSQSSGSMSSLDSQSSCSSSCTITADQEHMICQKKP
jgi:hypothetical protein